MFTWLFLNTLGALPLAAAALLARRIRRVTPGMEHFLWALVLLRLVAPPLGFLGPAPATSSSSSGSSSLSGIVASDAPSFGDAVVASVTRALGPNWSSEVPRALLVLFLAALAWIVLRELWRAWAIERCVRRAGTASSLVSRRVQRLAASLHAAAPRVRVSPDAAGPFLWSLRDPVLVLPAAERVPDATVLAHELAHLRRRDHWTAWLELAVQGLHFWNPLFWLARRHLRRTAELACDRWVVEHFPEKRRAFATALVETAERAAGGFVPRAVQALGIDRRDFEERLVRILDGDAGTRAPRILVPAGLFLALLSLPGLGLPTLQEFRASLPPLPAGNDLDYRQRSLEAAEQLVAVDPDDGAAQARHGISLLLLGRAADALAAFERQELLGFDRGKAFYNQACSLVKLGELDEALARLAFAAELGIDVRAFAAADPDLEPLRARLDDAGF